MAYMGKTKLNDAIVFNHGSIMLLRPLTPEAEAWCEEHLPEDGPRWGDSWVVEHRYVDSIVEGMREDGLRVT